MKIAARIFLENDETYVLGPGRLELLRSTDELGSLHKASQALGMSYRWAWGRIKDSEKALGVSLLTHFGKTSRGNPKVLTPEAREIIQWYTEVEKKIAATLREAAETCPSFVKLNKQTVADFRVKKAKTPLD